MPDPQPQALHQPTRHLSRAQLGSLDRMADFVGSVACPWWSLGMPRCPPSPGSKGRADRPARQSRKGQHHDRGQRQLRRQPHRRPRGPLHRGRDRPGHVPGGRVRAGGSRRRRSSPWSCGATRPSMPPSPCPRAAGSWSWAGSSSGPGPPRTAAPDQSSRSWPRSWGRACGGRRRPRPGRRAARASSQFDHYDGTGRKAKHASVPFRHVCAIELRCKKFLYELKAGLRAAASGGRPRPAAPSLWPVREAAPGLATPPGRWLFAAGRATRLVPPTWRAES